MNRLSTSEVGLTGAEVGSGGEVRPSGAVRPAGERRRGAEVWAGGEPRPAREGRADGAPRPGGGARAVDVHQHLWPPELITALRARRRPPRLRGWTLELAGEPDYVVDPVCHDVEVRAAQAVEDGLDLALVSLSSPLGIETLAPDEAGDLLDAYHAGVLALPRPFGGWAAACLTELDTGALTTRLEQGFVGLQLPATTLLDAAGYELVGPLLEVLEAAGRPLLIHPGPANGSGSAARAVCAAAGAPPWWPAIVPYVQQMHAAWFAFRAYGRPRHPGLRVCFAILAGLAPLHGERFAARAGGRNPVDPGVFLEISSYGTRAVDATIRVLGIDALVNGSDRPYADPVRLDLGAAALHALCSANVQRLLYPKEVVHDVAVAACA